MKRLLKRGKLRFVREKLTTLPGAERLLAVQCLEVLKIEDISCCPVGHAIGDHYRHLAVRKPVINEQKTVSLLVN